MKADISRVLAGQGATALVPRVAETVPAYVDTPTRVVGPPAVIGPLDDEPEEEERKSRVGLAVLITVLVVAVLAVGGYAIYQAITPETPVVQQVEVPNVITYTEQQARDQLAARNLLVEVKRENGDEETKGTITAQNPVAGISVEVASTVTVTLNEGPETAVIPDNLVGKDVDDVENDLQDRKFTNVVAVAAKSENPDTKPNEVLKISPKEGSTVALEAKITVTYATGKSEVPNFDGLPRQRAIEVADEAGFKEPSFKEKTSDAPEGTVIAQSPEAGQKVDRDTKISLTLAKAPVITPSPTPTPEPTTPTPSPTPT
jgi:serine/threonine-protein kinase